MIHIDGSFGEGGGQIIRSSLALSLITGKNIHITNIRAGRKKPGLLRQHLTGVKAAAAISKGEVKGAETGSKELYFKPGDITGGDFKFAVGTAGSTILVAQTILPALLTHGEKTTILIQGGTHTFFSPAFDFFKDTYLDCVNQMDGKVHAAIGGYGFYPAGGGDITLETHGVSKLGDIEILQRGDIKELSVKAYYSRLKRSVALDEVNYIGEKLNIPQDKRFIIPVNSPGPGNAVIITIKSEYITETISSYGKQGISRKEVARRGVTEAKKYIASQVPVGEHLADQLLLPMAIAGKGRFRTVKPSLHTKTNCEVIKQFLNVDITYTQVNDTAWDITIQGADT